MYIHAFDVMAKVLYGARGFTTLLFVVVCTIGLSNSAAVGDEKTNETSEYAGELSPDGFFYHKRLTAKQLNSTVTIEFNFKGINTKDRTVVKPVYWNVHREILNRLNRGKSNMTATTFSTSIAATTSTSTTPTPAVTSVATTATTTPRDGGIIPSFRKKRKKRQQTFNTVVIEETDLHFVEADPETDDNGVLAMILLLDVKGLDGSDCGLVLYEAVNQTTTDGTLHRVAKVPVVAIYRGLANGRGTRMSENSNRRIWPIVVLFVILLLVVILVIVGIVIWKKKTQTKLHITDRSKPDL